jgi:hypothetical protein
MEKICKYTVEVFAKRNGLKEGRTRIHPALMGDTPTSRTLERKFRWGINGP